MIGGVQAPQARGTTAVLFGVLVIEVAGLALLRGHLRREDTPGIALILKRCGQAAGTPLADENVPVEELGPTTANALRLVLAIINFLIS